MSGKKKALMVLIILLMLSAVVAGLAWHMEHYIMVDFRFYPKDAQYLDLRGEDISVRQYERICRRLPQCHVAWDVPLSSGRYDEEAEQITVPSLTDQDVELMEYFPALKTVRAEGCTDYPQLMLLRETYPQLQVKYTVTLGRETYANDVKKAELDKVTVEELELLPYLTELTELTCREAEPEAVAGIQAFCQERDMEFGLRIAGKTYMEDTKKMTITKVTEEDLERVHFLTGLEELHLSKPKASAESLLQLCKDMPQVDVSWEMEVCGVDCSTEDEEIDLSEAGITDLDKVEEAMAYFPNVEKVFLGKCAIENEVLAEFRDKVREDYKVVWVVELGKKLTARTDDTTFMPTREHVYYFLDSESYNLRYCEDMVCMDLGHMAITNVDFLEFMPDLEYLVLAHTQLQHIDPISNCKKMKFLELDWAPIKDYSPLVECTGLEDLNLGNTYADFEPIKQMDWLKNLWMVGCSRSAAYEMTQLFGEKMTVMVAGTITVGGGWRKLDNYYKMRDLLGMEYMDG